MRKWSSQLSGHAARVSGPCLPVGSRRRGEPYAPAEFFIHDTLGVVLEPQEFHPQRGAIAMKVIHERLLAHGRLRGVDQMNLAVRAMAYDADVAAPLAARVAPNDVHEIAVAQLAKHL